MTTTVTACADSVRRSREVRDILALDRCRACSRWVNESAVNVGVGPDGDDGGSRGGEGEEEEEGIMTLLLFW